VGGSSREILSQELGDIGRKLEQAMGMLRRVPKRSTSGAIRQAPRSKYF
jgi:hypothetical protein